MEKSESLVKSKWNQGERTRAGRRKSKSGGVRELCNTIVERNGVQ